MPTHAEISPLRSLKADQNLDGRQKSYSFSFYALLVFTFINYTGPQAHFPFLIPLRLAMTLIVIIGITHKMRSRREGVAVIQYDKETKSVIYMFILAIVSIPFSMWPGGSFTVLIDEYIKAIILFLLISNILTSSEQLKLMLFAIVIFCFYIAKIGIGNYFAGNFMENSNRILGITVQMAANPNDIATTLNLAIPFAVSLSIISKKKLPKIISLIYLPVAFYCVILTFSRGGFLTIATIVLMYIMKKLKGSPLTGVMFCIISIMIFIFVMPAEYTERLATIFEPNKESSSKIRKEVMIASLEIMQKNPLVGVGLGMNRLELNERGFEWQEVHSAFLQMGTDLGVPALLIFLSLLLSLVKKMRLIQERARSSVENKDLFYLAQALEISLVAFFVSAFFSPVAYHFYFYYLAGYAVALNRISNNISNSPVSSPS